LRLWFPDLLFNRLSFTILGVQALAPSLLDLVFDEVAPTTSLPPVDYLPALARQQELEKQLAEQQVCDVFVINCSVLIVVLHRSCFVN
jgi:hypothetical protein